MHRNIHFWDIQSLPFFLNQVDIATRWVQQQPHDSLSVFLPSLISSDDSQFSQDFCSKTQMAFYSRSPKYSPSAYFLQPVGRPSENRAKSCYTLKGLCSLLRSENRANMNLFHSKSFLAYELHVRMEGKDYSKNDAAGELRMLTNKK